MRSRVPVLVALLGLISLTAPSAFAAPEGTAATGCKAGSGTMSALTASYRFTLKVGMPEQMYTPAQVRKLHPKHGEVMLRGQMSGMSGMSMGGSMRHVEVQICARKGSVVVTTANPTITYTDASLKGMVMKMPVAVMEGVGEGVADLHYGNNVMLKPGHRYTIKVTLKGETATFHATVK